MKNSSKSYGFTLIESLVAIAILSIAVAGPLVTASRALVATEIAQDQFTASYLAQEGIEYVRALRDKEFLLTRNTNTAWANFKSGIEGICRSPASCTLDPTLPMGYGAGNAVQSYVGNAPLYLNGSNFVYTQQQTQPNIATKFTRIIQVSPASANDERATSTVTWSFHGNSYNVTSVDNLTSWE